MADAQDRPRALRPRNASSLVLADISGPAPRFLMGRRPGGHVFMAGKRVFPGGRLERADTYASAHPPLPRRDLHLLRAELGASASERRARAFAACAVRETEEETGLAVEPHLLTSPLRYAARAITPPGLPRRFDTRFFVATVNAGAASADGGDGELADIGWYRADEREEELHRATRYILEVVLDRLARDPGLRGQARVPFARVVNGKPVLDHR